MLEINEREEEHSPERRLFRKHEIADFWTTDKELLLPPEDNVLEIYKILPDGKKELVGEPQPLGLTKSTMSFLFGPGRYVVVLKHQPTGKFLGNCAVEITKDATPESQEIGLLKEELNESKRQLAELISAIKENTQQPPAQPATSDPFTMMERMMAVIGPLLAGKSEIEKEKIRSDAELRKAEMDRQSQLEMKKLEIKAEELKLQAAALREAAEKEARLIESQIEAYGVSSSETSRDAAQIIENYLNSFLTKNPQFGFLASILKPALSPLTHALLGVLSKEGIHIISDAELAERDKIYKDQIEALKRKAKDVAQEAYRRGYQNGLADGTEMAAREIYPQEEEEEEMTTRSIPALNTQEETDIGEELEPEEQPASEPEEVVEEDTGSETSD